MGVTLSQLEARLRGELDIIPSASSRDRIKDALRDIYDMQDWGCLFTDTYIRTPAQILGTANVTEFSKDIIVDVATATLIDAITVDQVPIVERQIRILTPVQVDRAFYYNIVNWETSTNTLTVDIPYQDITATNIQISIIKVFYSAPQIDIGITQSPNVVTDFKRFEYIISPIFNRRLCLDVTSQQLNNVDPSRIRYGDPHAIITHSYDINGYPRFELYPYPIFERILRIRYLRNGVTKELKDADQIPNVFSQELILAKAKQKAYEWAMVNQEKLELKNVGKFQNAIALLNSPNYSSSLPQLLERAIRNDEQMYPKAYIGDFSEVPMYDFDFGQFGGYEYALGETIIIDAQWPN